MKWMFVWFSIQLKESFPPSHPPTHLHTPHPATSQGGGKVGVSRCVGGRCVGGWGNRLGLAGGILHPGTFAQALRRWVRTLIINGLMIHLSFSECPLSCGFAVVFSVLVLKTWCCWNLKTSTKMKMWKRMSFSTNLTFESGDTGFPKQCWSDSSSEDMFRRNRHSGACNALVRFVCSLGNILYALT